MPTRADALARRQAPHTGAIAGLAARRLEPAVPDAMADRLVDAVLDREEWDEMDPGDRAQAGIDDLVMPDEAAALAQVAAGGDPLRG